GDSDPQRPEHGAGIADADVVPRERGPDRPALQPLSEVIAGSPRGRLSGGAFDIRAENGVHVSVAPRVPVADGVLRLSAQGASLSLVRPLKNAAGISRDSAGGQARASPHRERTETAGGTAKVPPASGQKASGFAFMSYRVRSGSNKSGLSLRTLP